jgi:radical SAM family uncharacterized protein
METGTPLRKFDLVGFSLQHELIATNVLYMLDLAQIPWRRAARGPEDPLLVAGGTGAFTPEPLAEVFDLFLPGDGEMAFPQLIALVRELRKAGVTGRELLREAALRLPFVYVPSLYEPEYSSVGRFEGLAPQEEGIPARIQSSVVEDLESLPIPRAPVQPGIRCVHDRITLEIMRGCTRGCRFCQAGMIKRPLRTRSPETLLAAARSIYTRTGYDEISLCSLSSSDYPELDRLMNLFNDHFEPLKVGLSLPSLRIGRNLKSVPALSAAVRKAGFTLAPEAATDRLRMRINKEITNDDLEEAVREAYEAGWRKVKLYFMIGLPGETEEDVMAIARLARRISDGRRHVGKGPAWVNVTVSTFVPKAHTPFQWCSMARPEAIREKQQLLLRSGLPRHIRFKFHNNRMSFVEGMLARGDRRMFSAVERAFQRGASFDSWQEWFSFSPWEKAFEEADMDPEDYLYRERKPDEAFPWDHIVSGPCREFLLKEHERSRECISTPYCEGAVCHQCGIDPMRCAALKKNRGGQKD